jgi:hypothetical protein
MMEILESQLGREVNCKCFLLVFKDDLQHCKLRIEYYIIKASKCDGGTRKLPLFEWEGEGKATASGECVQILVLKQDITFTLFRFISFRFDLSIVFISSLFFFLQNKQTVP